MSMLVQQLDPCGMYGRNGKSEKRWTMREMSGCSEFRDRVYGGGGSPIGVYSGELRILGARDDWILLADIFRRKGGARSDSLRRSSQLHLNSRDFLLIIGLKFVRIFGVLEMSANALAFKYPCGSKPLNAYTKSCCQDVRARVRWKVTKCRWKCFSSRARTKSGNGDSRGAGVSKSGNENISHILLVDRSTDGTILLRYGIVTKLYRLLLIKQLLQPLSRRLPIISIRLEMWDGMLRRTFWLCISSLNCLSDSKEHPYNRHSGNCTKSSMSNVCYWSLWLCLCVPLFFQYVLISC